MNDVGKLRGSVNEYQHVPNLDREQVAFRYGFKSVAGVDESGRGPLAGPVVVSAVILGQHWNPRNAITSSGNHPNVGHHSI